MEDLDRKGIRTRQRPQSDGSVTGGIRFGVGPLAYLLRNRFVIGEVVYRCAVHRGVHEPIADRTLLDAVQKKLAASATARALRLRASPVALLAGRFFDDRGNRMTPTLHQQAWRALSLLCSTGLEDRIVFCPAT